MVLLCTNSCGGGVRANNVQKFELSLSTVINIVIIIVENKMANSNRTRVPVPGYPGTNAGRAG